MSSEIYAQKEYNVNGTVTTTFPQSGDKPLSTTRELTSEDVHSLEARLATGKFRFEEEGVEVILPPLQIHRDTLKHYLMGQFPEAYQQHTTRTE